MRDDVVWWRGEGFCVVIGAWWWWWWGKSEECYWSRKKAHVPGVYVERG